MIFKLWHGTDIVILKDWEKAPFKWMYNRNRYYALVATVEAANIEEVFEAGNNLTTDDRVTLNNIDFTVFEADRWNYNPLHSTAVGDVVESPSGKAYVVTPDDWISVQDSLFNPLYNLRNKSKDKDKDK